jgi:Arc/MetJ family transcription regulator
LKGSIRITVELPADLLTEAKVALGTESTTVAPVTALRELVAARARDRLLEMDWTDLTPESVDTVRQTRRIPRG